MQSIRRVLAFAVLLSPTLTFAINEGTALNQAGTTPTSPTYRELEKTFQDTKSEIQNIEIKQASPATPPSTPLKIDAPTLANQIKAADEAGRRAQEELVDAKYKGGMRIITLIAGSANTVDFIVSALDISNDLARLSNLWSDKDFRNAWDTLEDWGILAGAVTSGAGVAVAASGSDSRQKTGGWIAAGGLGGIAVFKLVGTLFGEQNGDKFKEKARFIEYTRRAYDDLVARVMMFRAFREANKDFLNELSSFSVQYSDLKNFKGPEDTDASDEATQRRQKMERQRRAISMLYSKYQRFSIIMNQISEILNNYEIALNRHLNNEETPAAVKKALTTAPEGFSESVQVKIAKAKEKFEQKVKPFLLFQDVAAEVFAQSN
ncbi:hypothetical protein OWM54_32140 [Myxococcus sp. MISCRS1]|uniref:hypothetical protein n=1 Tax=Myxococcus TaxID=32 RepID=UPI002270D8CF|nr:hypothetical protein [Myxococcus sp. MISCRS1]MCY1001816.1 hypothetical protein [Myxococcus sp. MISCRS1]